jgi:hypothetical protein
VVSAAAGVIGGRGDKNTAAEVVEKSARRIAATSVQSDVVSAGRRGEAIAAIAPGCRGDGLNET